LIPTVKIETRNPVEGYIGSEFPAIYNHCGEIFTFFSKKPLQENFQNSSGSFNRDTDRRVVFTKVSPNIFIRLEARFQPNKKYLLCPRKLTGHQLSLPHGTVTEKQ